jgi:hypothetical protein
LISIKRKIRVLLLRVALVHEHDASSKPPFPPAPEPNPRMLFLFYEPGGGFSTEKAASDLTTASQPLKAVSTKRRNRWHAWPQYDATACFPLLQRSCLRASASLPLLQHTNYVLQLARKAAKAGMSHGWTIKLPYGCHR